MICIMRDAESNKISVFGDPATKFYQYAWGNAYSFRDGVEVPGDEFVEAIDDLEKKSKKELLLDLKAALHYTSQTGSVSFSRRMFTKPEDRPIYWPSEVPWDSAHRPSKLSKAQLCHCVRAYHHHLAGHQAAFQP